MVIKSKNSVAMMGRVRSKSNNLPASACAAGTSAVACAASASAGSLTRSIADAIFALGAATVVAEDFFAVVALATTETCARALADTKDMMSVVGGDGAEPRARVRGRASRGVASRLSDG